jgi:hypothetical protein
LVWVRVRTDDRYITMCGFEGIYLKKRVGASGSVVEHDLAKVGAAGSSPVSRSYTKDKGGFPAMEVRFFVI